MRKSKKYVFFKLESSLLLHMQSAVPIYPVSTDSPYVSDNLMGKETKRMSRIECFCSMQIPQMDLISNF